MADDPQSAPVRWKRRRPQGPVQRDEAVLTYLRDRPGQSLKRSIIASDLKFSDAGVALSLRRMRVLGLVALTGGGNSQLWSATDSKPQ